MGGIAEIFGGIAEFFQMAWGLIQSVLMAIRLLWQSAIVTIDTVETSALIFPAVLGGIMLVSLLIILLFRILLR